MADSLTKSRIISFRVSDEEYRVVDEACKKLGFSSVSLFARSAALTGQAQEPRRSGIEIDIGHLWLRVDELTASLQKIAAHLCLSAEGGAPV